MSLRSCIPAAVGLLLLLALGTAGAADKLDLNTATASELASLKGLGPVKAQKIVEYRKEHGPFATPHDLVKVPGFGEKTYERLAPLLTVSGGSAAFSTAKSPKQAGAQSEPGVLPERILPEQAVKMVCWSCKSSFWLERPATEGWCPFCGKKWAVQH
jgi:competence protein ComEA